VALPEPVSLTYSPWSSDVNVQVNQKVLQKLIPAAISIVLVGRLFILLLRFSKELAMLT
jgi:hypothetical protein